MKRTLVIEPEAELEIEQAATHYYQENSAAGAAFRGAVDLTLGFIDEHPEQYQIAYRQIRRAPLRGFPYAFFYCVTETLVIVVSCFHTSRDPDAWP